MARGIKGSGQGFDAPAAGKVGGRWHNPTQAEARLAALKVVAEHHSPCIVHCIHHSKVHLVISTNSKRP